MCLFLEYQNQVIIDMTVFLSVDLVVILTLAFGIENNCRFWNTKSKSFFNMTLFLREGLGVRLKILTALAPTVLLFLTEFVPIALLFLTELSPYCIDISY